MPAGRTTRKGPTPRKALSNGEGAIEGTVVDADDAFDLDFDEVIENETAAAADKPYRFKLKGTIYELPNARTVSLRQAQNMEDDLRGALSEIATPELAEVLADQMISALTKLVEKWMAHAGLGGGKTSASRG